MRRLELRIVGVLVAAALLAGCGATSPAPEPPPAPPSASTAPPTVADSTPVPAPAPDSASTLPGTATPPARPDSTSAATLDRPAGPASRGDEPAPAPMRPESLAALRSDTRGIDYLWVVRTSLKSPASVDSVVERARRMGVRGLLAQVVGRGDAWYRSDLLPRPESLDGAEPGFDPLGRLIDRAHAAGLEVHAWMNCMLVWSGPTPPRDPRHVVRAHPEWIAMLADGRRLSALSPRALERLGVEGVFLAPSHPRVREWVASIAAEIAVRYPVDGIHLDYIRCPDVETGYDPNTRARFALEHGIDPPRIALAPSSVRWRMLQQFRAFQRAQVTEVVRHVRDSLLTRRPELPLSAAVVADTGRAEGLTAQSWRAWLRDGLLDRAYPMCYSPDVQRVMSQLLLFRRELGADPRVVPGIAVYNTTPATAAAKIKGARALGYPLLALYSYDSLFDADRRWPLLERGLEPPNAERGP